MQTLYPHFGFSYCFHGIESSRSTDGLYLSQHKYIHDRLVSTSIKEDKPVITPMSSSTHLSSFREAL